MNSREKDVRTKKEGDPNYSKFPKISSRQWSCHKNPRIVRVSSAFGGKDRHSKVCTVRGLRDRRIRLSVPTAIQLYDLQDRLGLSQPSKVVDWLLDATKHEIDKLPPLPALPGNFTQFHQPTQVASHQSAANPQSSLSHFLASNHHINAKNSGFHPTKEGIASQQEQGNQDQGFGGFVAQLSKQNLFPLNNQSSFPNLPYNSYNFHWDHPSLSLSHIGGGYNLLNQTEDQSHNNNLSTILSPSSQLYFTPCATTIPSIIPSFPSYITPSMDNDWRQMNNLQHVQQNPLLPTTLHLISSPMKSLTPNVNSKSINSQPNGNKRRGKDDRS